MNIKGTKRVVALTAAALISAAGLSLASVATASAASQDFLEGGAGADTLNGGANVDQKFQRFASEQAEDRWEATYRWDD